jgi:hypothetical protein
MKLALSGGKQHAIIDDADVPLVSGIKWRVRKGKAGKVYVVGRPQGGRFGRSVLLHRFITASPPELEVDHVNGDGLDNRRSNLRRCDHLRNAFNRCRRQRNNAGEEPSSVFKGVNLHKASGEWTASITAAGKRHHLGLFSSERDAANAYNIAAVRLHGQFARLNVLPRVARRKK